MRELPREARTLLSEHVDSVGKLDLLMLLSRNRSRAWRVDEICDELRCPPRWARQCLATLGEVGLLVEHDGRHLCVPASRELDAALAALEHAQETRFNELTDLVASPPRRRRRLAEGERGG